MADNKKTIFQELGSALLYGFDKNIEKQQKVVHSYTVNNNDVIFKTKDKNELEKTKTQLRQEKYLANQWIGAGLNLNQTTALVSNNLKLMYRDADIMANWPEIGAALELVSEEANTTNMKGQILNITSKSDRIKKILDDLFVNRLDVHVNLPMWTHTMCKYGNAFIMLNITSDNGIIGARQLPTYEIERIENGVYNPYSVISNDFNNNKDVEFIWMGQNVGMPFKSWQIAHFRLLNESTFLPYGTSFVNKARRHFRILSMMEDMMLIYRLERSIERRVFKIYVGNIDDADIPAYVQEIANTFKRTPIIDPETGQLDIRKNMMSVDHDIFIPVHDQSAASPIDTLPSASNLDKIEDLKYIQNKILTALRIPKEFLNFEESAGDGKNLAIKDIRFTRTINRIQQSLIMELTKIAIIHLYLNGFEDELNNFKITMNNPSTQSEILKLEELSKKISLVATAVQDPGNGIQAYSLTRAQREILGWSDEEITQNMLEIRMEKALAAELAKTEQIIKRTGLFDKIDDMYGEPNAEYASGEGMGEDGPGGGGLGGGGGMGGFDSGLGEPGGESNPDMGGDLSPDLGGAPSDSESGMPPIGGGNESGSLPPKEPEVNNNEQGNTPKLEMIQKKANNLITEQKTILEKNYKKRKTSYFESYMSYINKNNKKINENVEDIVPIFDKAFMKNEETNQLIKLLDNKLKNNGKI